MEVINEDLSLNTYKFTINDTLFHINVSFPYTRSFGIDDLVFTVNDMGLPMIDERPY